MTMIRAYVADKVGCDIDDMLIGECFVGRSSKEVYDDYVKWAGNYAVSDYRSFAKIFPRVANVKTVSVCGDGVVRRVYALRERDDALMSFVGEKDRYSFVGEATGKMWEMYREHGGLQGKTEFSRRLCALFNLCTETKYVEGEYIRVFCVR